MADVQMETAQLRRRCLHGAVDVDGAADRPTAGKGQGVGVVGKIEMNAHA